MSSSRIHQPETAGNEVESLTLGVVGLDCADCAATVTRAVQTLSGVDAVDANLLGEQVTVVYDKSRQSEASVRNAIERAGYRIREGLSDQVHVFRIEGLCCTTESSLIEAQLSGRPDVARLSFDYVAQSLTVEGPIPPEHVRQVVEQLGMRVRRTGVEIDPADARQRRARFLLLLAGVGFWASSLVTHYLLQHEGLTALFAVLAIFVGGRYIIPQGVRAARTLALDMNFLMSIAAFGALFIGEYVEAASAMVLFALAQLLEARSMAQARTAIRSLMELTPTTAAVLRDDQEARVPADEVRVGERVRVRPGEKIPVDGVVVRGSSLVNQAPVTGESIPVMRDPGEEVFAGTLNGDGVLEIRSTRPADDTTLARIIHSVNEARSARAPSQMFVDRFARIYTPAVVLAAIALVFLPPLLGLGAWSVWFHRALVLLVVACPCALVISTPVTIVSALAGAARQGILIKGGLHLENIARSRVMAFDKTGTLTRGEPAVTRFEPADGISRESLLAMVAAAEWQSEHPLARAIVRYAAEHGIQPPRADAVMALPGRGVRAEVDDLLVYVGTERLFREAGVDPQELKRWTERTEASGATLVFVGTRAAASEPLLLRGMITISDRLRPGASHALSRLHELGISRLVMLTGDNAKSAGVIAESLGSIDEFRAELLPHDKVHAIRDLREEYGEITFVGDGVNDAPGLAAASVGIAMGSGGTDVALESADIALIGDDLQKLPVAVRLARKAQRIIRMNIAIALLTKAVFMLLALIGSATLWMAVAADLGTSLLVIMNGMRALRA